MLASLQVSHPRKCLIIQREWNKWTPPAFGGGFIMTDLFQINGGEVGNVKFSGTLITLQY